MNSEILSGAKRISERQLPAAKNQVKNAQANGRLLCKRRAGAHVTLEICSLGRPEMMADALPISIIF